MTNPWSPIVDSLLIGLACFTLVQVGWSSVHPRQSLVQRNVQNESRQCWTATPEDVTKVREAVTRRAQLSSYRIAGMLRFRSESAQYYADAERERVANTLAMETFHANERPPVQLASARLNPTTSPVDSDKWILRWQLVAEQTESQRARLQAEVNHQVSVLADSIRLIAIRSGRLSVASVGVGLLLGGLAGLATWSWLFFQPAIRWSGLAKPLRSMTAVQSERYLSVRLTDPSPAGLAGMGLALRPWLGTVIVATSVLSCVWFWA